ncbi:MAG: aminotransferase class I/II-fold pyridoxal phosphate-dependent enzyme [Anaerovoracaceae bacterium]
MFDFIIAQQNGRVIPKEDKIFALNGRAKKKIEEEGKGSVINATIGALLDDEGNLVVLKSVGEGLKRLTLEDYAEYAPIAGTPGFKAAVEKAAFGEFKTNRFVKTVYTPGGTGAIRNTIANYSKIGDKVLTSDWYWGPYSTICQEISRNIDTYELFDGEGKFNIEAFANKVNELALGQGQLVILLNTPAHNPTGYSLTDKDWDGVIGVLNDEKLKDTKIALLVDTAYVDFAGDPEEYRSFLPKLEDLNENILPIIAYSASKTYTLYGMRCGAMICMAKTEAIADEFQSVCEFSCRGSWSNGVRAAQALIEIIHDDEELCKSVDHERELYRDMLLERGRAFEEELKKQGVEGVPFDAGFFACVACDDPDEISKKLEAKGIFAVPLAKGIRVSVASISKEACVKVAKAIKEVL